MIIGISGYIGSGKDTVAKMVQILVYNQKRVKGGFQSMNFDFNSLLTERKRLESTGWEIKKFAGKLKQICSLLTGIPVEDFEKQSVKDSELGEEWDYWDYAVGYYANNFDAERHMMTYTGYRKMITKKAYTEIFFDGLKDHHRAEHHKLTVRGLLQRMGTDAMRDQVHPNIHVNALFADYTGLQDVDWVKKRIENGWTPPYCINCKKITESVDLFVCKQCIQDHTVYPNWIISDCRFPNEAQAIKDRSGIVIRVNRSIPIDSDGFKKVIPHASETSLDSWPFDAVIENNGTMEDLLVKVQDILKQYNII
jgi:hypothetical protein